MLHIVSYNYPPDNVPAAHRPGELVDYLAACRKPFKLFTRHGYSRESKFFCETKPEITPRAASSMQKLLYSVASRLTRPLLEFDKAIPWAIQVLPRLWISLMATWIHERRRPDVWVTGPLLANVYVGSLAAFFSGSRLHVDLRDVVRGLDAESMPFMTWLALRYAHTCSVVTPVLAKILSGRIKGIHPLVIYNGISHAAIRSALKSDPFDHEITITYTGAVYGGDRPYQSLLNALREASEIPGATGIKFAFIGRENIAPLVDGYRSTQFQVVSYDEMGKMDALAMAAKSAVNVVLVGSSFKHRNAIPLKVFDLLGLGRPILYHGPLDSEALQFIQSVEPSSQLFALDSESSYTSGRVSELAVWLRSQYRQPSRPLLEPSSVRASAAILELICSADQAGSHDHAGSA